MAQYRAESGKLAAPETKEELIRELNNAWRLIEGLDITAQFWKTEADKWQAAWKAEKAKAQRSDTTNTDEGEAPLGVS